MRPTWPLGVDHDCNTPLVQRRFVSLSVDTPDALIGTNQLHLTMRCGTRGHDAHRVDHPTTSGGRCRARGSSCARGHPERRARTPLWSWNQRILNGMAVLGAGCSWPAVSDAEGPVDPVAYRDIQAVRCVHDLARSSVTRSAHRRSRGRWCRPDASTSAGDYCRPLWVRTRSRIVRRSSTSWSATPRASTPATGRCSDRASPIRARSTSHHGAAGPSARCRPMRG